MNSKSNQNSGYNPGRLEKIVRAPNYSEDSKGVVLTRLITMKASSNPSCFVTRDLTYSRVKTDIVARASKVMMMVANAGPVLRSPPAGGLTREAIVEFFGKAEECTRRLLIQAGRFSDTMEVGSGN